MRTSASPDVVSARVVVAHPVWLVAKALAWHISQFEPFNACTVRPLHDVCDGDADIVLVVTDGPRDWQLASIREAKRGFPEASIVVLGGSRDPATTVQYVECGASAFIPVDAQMQQSLFEMRRVLDHKVSYDPEMLKLLFRRLSQLSEEAATSARHSPPSLTQRENEVLALVSKGLSNKEIAAALGLQLSTVKNHVHNILEKLGARNRLHARVIADENALT